MATAKASRAKKTDNPPADTTRQLTSTQFLRTWRHYDTDGNGYIENDELDAFLKEMLSDHCGQEIDESLLAASKAKFLAKYDQNYDGRISLEELAVILPTEESFLLRFRGKINLSSVDFMQIWRQYDEDRSGFIEADELKGFIRDLMLTNKEDISPQIIDDYEQTMLELFDVNHDGCLDLNELAKVLPVEENYILKLKGKKQLTRNEMTEFFQHYDQDNNGKISGAELMALLRDMLQAEGKEPNFQEIKEFHQAILSLCDVNHDGMIDEAELTLLLSPSAKK